MFVSEVANSYVNYVLSDSGIEVMQIQLDSEMFLGMKFGRYIIQIITLNISWS